MQYVCPAGVAPGVVTPFFVANGTPAAPAVDPAVLAQEAFQRLPIPKPDMNFGPDPTKIAVRYWTYLWVSNPAPVKATANAGAVTVTAIATLTSVIWTMGEPVSADNLNTPAPALTCQGPGSDPGTNADITLPPGPGFCAYTFNVRSTPERTNGTGAWPVTATANWSVSWKANTGQSGIMVAPTQVSTTAVCVGAWGTVIVANGYTAPSEGHCAASN